MVVAGASFRASGTKHGKSFYSPRFTRPGAGARRGGRARRARAAGTRARDDRCDAQTLEVSARTCMTSKLESRNHTSA